MSFPFSRQPRCSECGTEWYCLLEYVLHLDESHVGAHLTRQLEFVVAGHLGNLWFVKPVSVRKGCWQSWFRSKGGFSTVIMARFKCKARPGSLPPPGIDPKLCLCKNTGSEHFRTFGPTEIHHWNFTKYFSSCLRERTKILPIDGHVEFSQEN